MGIGNRWRVRRDPRRPAAPRAPHAAPWRVERFSWTRWVHVCGHYSQRAAIECAEARARNRPARDHTPDYLKP